MTKFGMLFLVLLPVFGFAQSQEKKEKGSFFSLNEYAPMQVAYYGNAATHPGLKVGVDWSLMQLQRSKENKRRIKSITHLLTVTPSVAFYKHPASHSGLILSTDVSWRRYGKNLFRETAFGLGYYARFNSGETWVVSETGEVTNQKVSGRGYFSPAVSYALGKRFQLQENLPLEVYARLGANLLANYNAGLGIEYSTEIGVRFNPAWGIKRKAVQPKLKAKKA